MHTGLPLLRHIPMFLVVSGPCGTMRSAPMVHSSNSGSNIGVAAHMGGRALCTMACERKCWLVSVSITLRIVLPLCLLCCCCGHRHVTTMVFVCLLLYNVTLMLFLPRTIQYCSYLNSDIVPILYRPTLLFLSCMVRC